MLQCDEGFIVSEPLGVLSMIEVTFEYPVGLTDISITLSQPEAESVSADPGSSIPGPPVLWTFVVTPNATFSPGIATLEVNAAEDMTPFVASCDVLLEEES